eukprot:TRINITY_DN1954_c0_g1_i2.p1 TRINITY_DN1954_c0_g1~~TRINITY_DN1954_c0_g1_i2.p1  ORF type:complete len:688 (+),score=183.24 TRINITY_DN1954_c0_g1_i2:110-2173(+)
MAGDAFEKDVESELTCPVCLGLFEKPQRLDCEHAFCQKCLQKLVKQDSVMLSCPACRSVTTLRLPGFLGVARLPMDFRLVRLVEKYLMKIGPEELSDEEGDPPESQAKLVPAAEFVECVPFEHIDLAPCSEVMHGYTQFDLSIERTQDMFDKWKKNLWLCPTDFPKKALLSTVRMVSVPFYVFSVKTQVDFKSAVACPQDGKAPATTVNTNEEVITSRISTPIMINNNDPCSNHPSRRWIHSAVGSTILHKTTVTHPAPANTSWGTWLWSQAQPILPSKAAALLPPPQNCKEDPLATSCSAAPTCSSSSSASSPAPSQQQKKYTMKVDNLEISTKVGQTYVSSTQPMIRNLSFSGKHNNSFTNMLVCASHAVDQDLVAALMTGHSKDEDLSLLTSIKLPPPGKGDNDEYLKNILELITKSSGIKEDKTKDVQEEDEEEEEMEKNGPAGQAQAQGQGQGPAECSDPSVVYEELMSTPAAGKNEEDGFPDYLLHTDQSEGVNAFFDEGDTVGSEAPEMPEPDSTVDGAGRVLATALEKQDYFSPANASLPPPQEDVTFYGKPEVLSPERRSEDAWKEQIWPHVQDKEISFTRSVIKSMEPKGATLESSDVELTVTELKQRAVLIPCYLATYKYEGKTYDLIIHGRTGEVHGKRPWIGSSAYDSVKREVEGQVFNVKHYIEESLDHFGVK